MRPATQFMQHSFVLPLAPIVSVQAKYEHPEDSGRSLFGV